MKERYSDIAGQLHEGQTKYVYFLMAVAASAIALCVKRTTGQPLAWSMLPLGGEVLAWAGSFFYGCWNRSYFLSSLFSSCELIRIQSGGHPDVGENQAAIQAASSGIGDALEYNNRKASLCFWLQFALLVIGAGLFLTWHIIEMAQANLPSMEGDIALLTNGLTRLQWE